MRIAYATGDAGNFRSAMQQILKLFSGECYSFRNFERLEDASFQACTVTTTYALPFDAQRAVVTQLIKQARHEHPMAHASYMEAKSILDRIVAAQATFNVEEYTDQLLLLLCDNKTTYARTAEMGLLDPYTISTKRHDEDEPDEAPPKKRTDNSCYACGRSGHKYQECSFVDQGHPDVNKERIPWLESTNGKAWAAKGKQTLPGNQTLSGEPFAFVNTKR